MIEQVFGITQTNVPLSKRFAMLGPPRRPAARRHPVDDDLIEQLARKIRIQKAQLSRLRAAQSRPTAMAEGMRRWGSEGTVFAQPRTRRASSVASFHNGSMGNLSRIGSYANLSQAGGPSLAGGRGRGQKRGRGRFKDIILTRNLARIRMANLRRQFNSTRGARGRVRGRGGRTQSKKPVPSKEQLDNEIDKYMASTKTVLDHQLDDYMSQSMETEQSVKD